MNSFDAIRKLAKSAGTDREKCAVVQLLSALRESLYTDNSTLYRSFREGILSIIGVKTEFPDSDHPIYTYRKKDFYTLTDLAEEMQHEDKK